MKEMNTELEKALIVERTLAGEAQCIRCGLWFPKEKMGQFIRGNAASNGDPLGYACVNMDECNTWWKFNGGWDDRA
jgi:hypothetical protein